MEPIRLQKYFSDCGVLSRRSAEAEIKAGRVTVNGATATIGMKVTPTEDTVVYKGKKVLPQSPQKHYIMLNKPRGYVSTLADEKGRHTVAELVANLGFRVYPVGRLDMDSDGLLLLTDDGALCERLTHPRHEIAKHYLVEVQGEVLPPTMNRLNESFRFDGYDTLPAKVFHEGFDGVHSLLSFELHEGRNRQIRRMCEEVGLTIKRLTRVAVGHVKLGELPLGHYRALSPSEVAYLKGETR